MTPYHCISCYLILGIAVNCPIFLVLCYISWKICKPVVNMAYSFELAELQVQVRMRKLYTSNLTLIYIFIIMNNIFLFIYVRKGLKL